MAGFFPWIRQHSGGVLAACVSVMAIAGISFFVLAFQECRFAPAAGATWQYQLTTELFKFKEDGTLGDCEARLSHDLDLLCLNNDNEIALVSAEQRSRGNGRVEMNRMHVSPKGQVSRYLNDEVLNNSGQLVGHFFDFNLFPLPEGLEQSWSVPMVYGILPPQKNQVVASVKRVRNGSRPKFQLTFPPVAWVKKSPKDFYSQISSFRCDYVFDIKRGIIEEAHIDFVFARERPHPENVRQYKVRMKLLLSDYGKLDNLIAGRDMALSVEALQNAYNKDQLERVREILAQLDGVDLEALHPSLKLIYDSIKRESQTEQRRERARPQRTQQQTQQQQTQRTPAQSGRYALQIASIGLDRKSAGLREVEKIKRQGYNAFLGKRNNYYIICVGPYEQKEAAVRDTFLQRDPDNPPIWVSLQR